MQGDLIQVNGQVLQLEIHPTHIINLSIFPGSKLDCFEPTFINYSILTVLLLIKANLVLDQSQLHIGKIIVNFFFISLAVVPVSAFDNINMDLLRILFIVIAINLKLFSINTARHWAKSWETCRIGSFDRPKRAAWTLDYTKLFLGAYVTFDFLARLSYKSTRS